MASSLTGNPKEKWIRSFTVTEPTKHVKGFTVYKVTYKAFSLNRPDDVVEIVVWKRYNDFKKLHKALYTLHYHLRRPEKFPDFAKAKFFGRFDDQVIDERRKSALRLLEFAASVPPLTRNIYFTKFFEGGDELTSSLPTQKTSILQPRIITPVEEDTVTPDTPQENKDSVSTKEGGEGLKEGDQPLTGNKNGYTPPLGGIWLHRQAEDEEVIDYGDLCRLDDDDDDDDDDDRTTFSEDSVPSTPLPQLQDLSLFDPLSEDMPESGASTTIPHSNSWLFHAMDMCAELNQDSTDSPQDSGQSVTDVSTDSGITINFSATTSQTSRSDLSISDSAVSSSANEPNVATPNFGLPSPVDNSSPDSREQRSSMARAYLNSIRAQHAASLDGAHAGVVDTRSGPGTPEKKSRTDSVNSTYSAADVEIGGVEDYLYQAARHISLALDNEANSNYQMAFDLYKEGVGILLKGVIGDNNKTRREAVRRKTAQYLMKAEDLYNKYLSAAAANARRWESQKMIVEFDSSSAHLKCPTEDMRNYKVLGIIDRVLLVLDMVSYQTYAIKVLRKHSVANKNRRTVVPADCPYMVKLYRYFETDCSIFLVLEHATGGKLWSYASAYLHHDLTSKVPFVSSLERSFGSRGSRKSRTSSSIGGLEDRVRRISGGEDNVFDEDSSPRKSGSKPKIESVPEDGKVTKIVQSDEVDRKEFCDPKSPIADESYIADDSTSTLVPHNHSTPQKIERVNLNDSETDKTPVEIQPGLSESPEVATSYANIFSYAKKTPSVTKDNADDFMHIEDTEDAGSNLNDLVQVSSQYDDVSADDSLGLGLGDHDQSSASPFSDNVFISAGDSSHNKSFNTTVNQVNTKPPPMTLFSIDSSDSPDVQSVESLERPLFRYSSDNPDLHGSLEGLGQLDEETENDSGTLVENEMAGVWDGHDPDHVMADAVKAMQELEQNDLTTTTARKDNSSSLIIPDTSGFGEVLDDSELSTPGIDLANFFDNSGDTDRGRAVSSPSQGVSAYGNPDYESTKRSASVSTAQDNSATTYPFMESRSPTSGLAFGSRNSFGSSEGPKSSLEDLLAPSDTQDIESEWEKSATTSTNDTSRTDQSELTHHDHSPSQNELSNGARTDLLSGFDSNGGTEHSTFFAESGALSGNESAESSTTPKELPSSIYSSTQSTPKHALANSKMVDWPGDVQTDVQSQLESSRQDGDNAPLEQSNDHDKSAKPSDRNNRKSKMPETRMPSLSTFLAQMDEATAKHASLTTLPESCVRMWAAEIVIALSNLHAAGIICKDLRPHNILLAEGGHIRLSYFSQWKCVEPDLSSYACDHFYTAPEVKGVYNVTEACDWWSLGAILFELLTSKSLYTRHPSGINSHTQLDIPDHVSTEARGIIAQVNPLERLGSGMTGVEDVKAHPFFHGINWTLYKG